MCEDCGEDDHRPELGGLLSEELQDELEAQDDGFEDPTDVDIYGNPSEEYFEPPEGEEVSIDPPLIKRRWGFQLAPTTGDCRVWHRETWEPMRSWRKHLLRKKPGPEGGMKCRRCGHDPDDIPF
jgi:hypothetical protein